MAINRRSLADRLRNDLEVETKPTSELSKIFAEEPPPLDVFVRDTQYMDQDPFKLGEIQYDFVRHFEQVLDLPTYIMMVEVAR